MATILSTKTSGVGGLTVTCDASGVLQLASADGTTAVTIDASQNVTFAKGLTVGATAAPAFRCGQSNVVIPTNNVSTKITINTALYDTNSNFNISTYRFTPTVAGYYQLNGTLQGSGATSTNLAEITIYKNGALSIQGNLFYSAATGFNVMQCVASGFTYMNGTTDYVELYGRVLGTGTLNLAGGNFSGFLARSA